MADRQSNVMAWLGQIRDAADKVARTGQPQAGMMYADGVRDLAAYLAGVEPSRRLAMILVLAEEG